MIVNHELVYMDLGNILNNSNTIYTIICDESNLFKRDLK